ncbi:MAG: ArsA-related P-loop ATPase [Nocardioidaceae bacterium]
MTAAAATPAARSSPVRVHVVTGKGGTGKTTLAAALALALAGRGKKILLCEAEGRQGIAQMFDVPPLPYTEKRVAVASAGGQVYALAIDPEAALMEYLDMYYKLGRAGKVLDRFGVVDFATTIAPGLRDVLLTGKVYEAARRRDKNGDHTYDALVLDAPPTGRIARFLNVNREVAGLAKVGPIRNQADAIMRLLRSRRTAVHIAAVLEEMPVQEAVDAIAALQAADLPVGQVLVNQVRHSPLPPDCREALANGDAPQEATLASDLAKAGLDGAPGLATALLAEGLDHLVRLDLEDEQQAILDQLDTPSVRLPMVPEGIDLGALYDLGESMRRQGLA